MYSARIAFAVSNCPCLALSGVIEGARKRLDAVGICVVGGLAAFGGGTVRDVVLDRRPLFWIEHAGWLWALLALCIAAMVFMRARHLEPTERAMQWPDAIGLGLFSASGTQGRRCVSAVYRSPTRATIVGLSDSISATNWCSGFFPRRTVNQLRTVSTVER